MKVRAEPLDLHLKAPFRIAHGTSTLRHNALIRFDDSFGEAALPPYYAAIIDDIDTYVRSVDFASLIATPHYAIPQRLRQLPDGPSAAVAAVDMLALDVWGKWMNQPLYALFGLDPRTIPTGAVSLPIPRSLEKHREAVRPLRHEAMLKLKLGSGDVAFDEAIVRETRALFSGRLSVDVNGKWTVPEAISILPRLLDYQLEFVEQPISADEIDDWHILRRMMKRRTPTLIADESIHSSEDLIALAGAADGVNLKLAKCGGIIRTLDLISLARSLDMTVLIGCMIETSLSTTAAAHIAALADYVDLDGATYLKNDPFRGMTTVGGRICLSAEPGIGAVYLH